MCVKGTSLDRFSASLESEAGSKWVGETDYTSLTHFTCEASRRPQDAIFSFARISYSPLPMFTGFQAPT